MTSPERIVFFTPYGWQSAMVQLRMAGPAAAAGMEVLVGSDIEHFAPERIQNAGLVVIQRDFVRRQEWYRQVMDLARAHGKPVVFEIDDWLLALPEQHPDRKSHYYSSALFPMLTALLEADAVTTPSPVLAQELRRYNSRVYVLPNFLDDRIWRLPPPAPPTQAAGRLVVGYMGGGSHTPDLEAAAPALQTFLDSMAAANQAVTLRFWGARPPGLLLERPEVERTPLALYDYPRFAEYFQAQKVDIFIAPLEDNLFNACKSPIKFLEYSAMGVPGVYSRVAPYEQVIQNGYNGFLVETQAEWLEALQELASSPQRRYEVGLQAQQTVRQGWLLSQHAGLWRETYAEIQAQSEQAGANTALQIHETWLSLSKQLQTWQAQLQQNLESARQKASQADALKAENQALRQTNQALETRLERYYHSREYQNGQRLVRWIDRLTPPGSQRKQALQSGVRWVKKILGREKPAQVSGFSQEGSAARGGQLPAPPLDPVGIIPHQAEGGRFDVILFSIIEWDFRNQRPQHMARWFARNGHRVFYLDVNFNPILAGGQAGEPVLRVVSDNIAEIRLPGNQGNVYGKVMDDHTRDQATHALDALRREYHIGSAVCLVNWPFWTPVVFDLERQFGWRVVYDCMDHHAGFTDQSTEFLAQERMLAERSALVLVSSYWLLREIQPHNPNCLLVPNAAEFAHFNPPQSQRPADLPPAGAPLVGYYGAIASWFDSSLVAGLARARPDWQFVLIGSTKSADLAPLDGLDNVHLLGEKPYADLPGYLHAFDVAIIPFQRTPLTDATNPVKLFEYLSAGKPVIATALEELSYYQEYAALASSEAEWLQALDEAVHSPGRGREKRITFARQNTWDARMASAAPKIQALFPKISILILTYNNLDYTRLCLESIYKHTQYPNFEVIVVDNASQDDTPGYLLSFSRQRSNMQVVLNQENAGFAAGNNQAARLALQSPSPPEMLVFLNNDTVVTPGWLEGLAHPLKDPTVGLVGPVTNWSGNETRVPISETDFDKIIQVGRAYASQHAGQSFEIKMLPLLCAAVRRDVFEQVGFLDERFGMGMFEDDDYAMRIAQAGLKIVCTEDVFVYHWGRSSFSKLDEARYARLFSENKQKFEEKWGVEWQPHRYRSL